MLSIENNSFRIIGVLDDQSTGGYMPIQAAYQLLADKEQGVYDSIILKVKDSTQLDATIEKINTRLMLSRHVTDRNKDFTISSNAQMEATRADMMNPINIFLLAIAGVSLIVGGVGVANTLFTSVLERTKEIGIMKAIGARNGDILLIFVFNAGLIGLVGGILGVAFGALLSGILPAFTGGTPLGRGDSIVSESTAILALTVSVAIGIIAGIIPAYNASKLKPADALRYE
ncbi:hypothetical protein AUJ65_03455 [Candidatus Micrarchaeota archaeon CG1_02_51_15]|nr:MAG: hypothetical protein AUJ65_03455 [Candidatus Micrarchaeota archaeon CG1_02_51_15]